ncbi:MAG TPA: CDGSH iron-sulfur domain-containing protein [Acidimicrobiales bacterium]|nr:CDGSH iron-sulfur domain-containing protein [Acidimicrobiales bacterium]
MTTSPTDAESTNRTPVDGEVTGAIGRLHTRAIDISRRVTRLLATSSDATDVLTAIGNRLANSVIRPLGAAVGTSTTDAGVAPSQAEPDGPAPLAGELWSLAQEATALRVRAGTTPPVMEATAALQDLACMASSLGDSEDAAARLAESAEIQSDLAPEILAATDGPYLITNVARLTDWLGGEIPPRPQMALCRCGASSMKPLCDGSHARVGFQSVKSPARVPDRRDTYVGQQVTIFDNRGICQHSGYCTDRLATVFHAGDDPFVTPSGGRMDEIIRAVRDCPSGALSFAIDGQEARAEVDHGGTRGPAIEVTKDGPYRITGSLELHDGEGNDEPRAEGSSREHYALCRCGQSQNKPFCSGMHWYVDFHDPAPDPDREPTVYEWCGGLPALTRMTRLFYEKHVPEDPLLAPLFANMSADHPQRVAAWLGEVFGGPKSYSRSYGGYPRMISQHLGKEITEEKRARWVTLLQRSAVEAGLPDDPEFRSTFGSYIEWGSRLALENSQVGAQPPEKMPMPYWDWHTAAGAPGSRVSAVGPSTDDGPPMVLPGPDEPVSFEHHIKSLFRRRDRQSMTFAFDLWDFKDVKDHGEEILHRLADGSMPCDGTWPSERIAVFQRWVESGMPA